MGASMFLKDPSLSGKRVLVTAGASGLGLALARGVLESGARVLVCDVDPKAIDAVRAEFPALLATVADVSDESSVSALFGAVDAQLGGLDVMVNNAGIAGPTGTVENLRLEDWNRTLAVNVTGQFLCARLAVKAGSLGRPVADVAREYESQSAMGCLVTVADIANMALFASTDCARHITGQELVVDGYTQKLS